VPELRPLAVRRREDKRRCQNGGVDVTEPDEPRVCSRCGTASRGVTRIGHSLAEAGDTDNPLLCGACDSEVSR